MKLVQGCIDICLSQLIISRFDFFHYEMHEYFTNM